MCSMNTIPDDGVYIGASEYEILSVDDERVMLYDYDIPLFNTEFSRTEFDRCACA